MRTHDRIDWYALGIGLILFAVFLAAMSICADVHTIRQSLDRPARHRVTYHHLKARRKYAHPSCWKRVGGHLGRLNTAIRIHYAPKIRQFLTKRVTP